MQEKFMQEAIQLAIKGVRQNLGGPFGAIIVKDNQIIGRGNNRVTTNLDPTAHAEIVAIREACKNINNFSLQNCIIYTSCEPCPMCLGAIYWARIEKIIYAANRNDAKNIGFDDEFFYQELNKSIDKRFIPMQELLREQALVAFNEWQNKIDKIPY